MAKNPAKPPLPRLAGVIGWPIGHSMSPLIHQTFAAREGVDAVYLPIVAEPGFEAFARAAEALREMGFKGVNVTLPHKENALRYAETASDAAKKTGAANMLTFNTESGTVAANSDATGFRRMLLDSKVSTRKTLVIGAGGAARAILWALRRKPFITEVTVSNRTRARADEVALIANAHVIDWERRNDALADADLVVNTTSLGMINQPSLDLDCERLRPGSVVCDIVYTPLKTKLLEQAEARGLRTIDGLTMLMHQAVPGYKAWLGTRAEVDEDLRARLEAALAGGKTR